MIEHKPITKEVVDDLMSIVRSPSMDEIKPSSLAPVPTLERGESESDQDFLTRKVASILADFYEIKRENLLTPITIGPKSAPGLMIRYEAPVPITLSMDFPSTLDEMLKSIPNSFGCRISLICQGGTPEEMPNPVKGLPTLFSGLPGTVSYAPWQFSPLSKSGMLIYEALLVAPKNLHHHLAADCLARTNEWLHEKCGVV